MNSEVAFKLLAAGLAMIGVIGPGIGVGLIGKGNQEAVARNPEVSGELRTNMLLSIVLTEAIAIYALVVALILIFAA